MCVCVYWSFYTSRMWHKVICFFFCFATFNRFEFRFFSLSQTSYHTKIKEPSLCYNSWKENSWMHTCPKVINVMWNTNSLVQDLESPCPFPVMITITLFLIIENLHFFMLKNISESSIALFHIHDSFLVLLTAPFICWLPEIFVFV